MRNFFALTALSSVVVASMALVANSAMASELPVFVGGKNCGTFTAFSFDNNGGLQLTADLTCLKAADPADPADPVLPPVTPPIVTDPSVPVSCGPTPTNMIANNNNPWGTTISSDVRSPIALKKSQVYSLKLNKPAGVKGYGFFSSINTTRLAGMRTAVISECPGSMSATGTPFPNGYNACEVTGTEAKISWSFDENSPPGPTQCRLDPNKTYYINVTHADKDGKNSCTGSTCYYTYGHQVLGSLD